jgi:putative FmdB family regulatory protein
MPTYEYECKKCGVFEFEQKITEPALTKCPNCKGKQPVSRLLSAPAFHLKGGGWYKDLYSSVKPSDKSSDSSKSESAASPTAESKSSSDSSTKTKAKAESGSSAKKTEKKK